MLLNILERDFSLVSVTSRSNVVPWGHETQVLEIIEDIRLHLYYLLLSRSDARGYLPDYGLPDIAQVYQHLPNSINDFIKAIQRSVTRYEPRLNNVVVAFNPNLNTDAVISVHIQGQLLSPFPKEIVFEGSFKSGGGVIVKNA